MPCGELSPIELIEPPEGSLNHAGHAGQFETSLMLLARPELVHLERLVAG